MPRVTTGSHHWLRREPLPSMRRARCRCVGAAPTARRSARARPRRRCANCIAKSPIGPAPWTTTVSPGTMRDRRTPWKATVAGSTWAASVVGQVRMRVEDAPSVDGHAAGERTVRRRMRIPTPCDGRDPPAVLGEAALALRALSARWGHGDDDALAGLEALHRRAHGADGADPFVSTDRRAVEVTVPKRRDLGSADTAQGDVDRDAARRWRFLGESEELHGLLSRDHSSSDVSHDGPFRGR